MLKKLLATSALIAIGTVLIQSAYAADDLKTREIVVEQAGAHAPDAAGLPAVGAGKTENLIAKTGDGIPTPAQTADSGAVAAAANSAALGNKTPVNQLLVAPPSGAATPPAVIASPSGAATADAGTPAAGAANAAPPAGAAAPASPALAAPAAAPAAAVAAAAAPTAVAAPVAPAAVAAPAATAAPAAVAVKSADDLEKLLTARGYGVEVSQHDANGNEIFYVTIPGNTQDAYLLTVDEYGKVNKTKHISSYASGHSYGYAPTYSQAYDSNDNCDYGPGY
jgi:hypothetical protein